MDQLLHQAEVVPPWTQAINDLGVDGPLEDGDLVRLLELQRRHRSLVSVHFRAPALLWIAGHLGQQDTEDGNANGTSICHWAIAASICAWKASRG